MAENWTVDFCAAELHRWKKGNGRNSKACTFQNVQACLAFIHFTIIPPVQSEFTYNVPTATYFIYVS